MTRCDSCNAPLAEVKAFCAKCAALPPVRSEPLLAATFADFWHAKWPHQTRDVKRLEMSAHYVGCRDAFEAGAQAAKAEAERVRKVMRSALSEAENELRCFGSFDGHIARWEQLIDAANQVLSK